MRTENNQNYNVLLNNLITKLSNNVQQKRGWYSVYKDSKIIKDIIKISIDHIDQLSEKSLDFNTKILDDLLFANDSNQKKLLSKDEEKCILSIFKKLNNRLINIRILEELGRSTRIQDNKTVRITPLQTTSGDKSTPVQEKTSTANREKITGQNLAEAPTVPADTSDEVPVTGPVVMTNIPDSTPANGPAIPLPPPPPGSKIPFKPIEEPLFEMELKPLPFGWQKTATKETVSNQLAALKAALLPIKNDIKKFAELKKLLTRETKKVAKNKKKLAICENNLEAATNSDPKITRKVVESKKIRNVPYYSDARHAELNEKRAKFNKKPIPDALKKSELAKTMENRILEINSKIEKLNESIEKTNKELESFNTKENNKIPFKDFEKLYNKKLVTLEQLERFLRTKDKPVREVKHAAPVKNTKVSDEAYQQALLEDPDLKEFEELDQSTQIELKNPEILNLKVQ